MEKMKLIKEELLINSQSFKDISAIAKRLSEILEIGDILFLKGSIGAGKSFFARCIIREYLNISKVYEDIPSPSFSLVQTYDNIKPKVCHVDLYRISFSSELEEIGLNTIYENFLTIVEWPERLGEKIPDTFIQIEFKDCHKNYDERNLKISLAGINRKDIRSFLKELKNDFGVLS